MAATRASSDIRLGSGRVPHHTDIDLSHSRHIFVRSGRRALRRYGTRSMQAVSRRHEVDVGTRRQSTTCWRRPNWEGVCMGLQKISLLVTVVLVPIVID